MVLNKIRRITRDGRWIPEIDGLRFIAIASVILFHLAGEVQVRNSTPLVVEPRYHLLRMILDNGDRGVELFFVISGMILAMPFARHSLAAGKPVSLRKYYMRRLTRLEPPYIISLIVFTGMVAIYTHGHLDKGYWAHALAGMFYLNSLIYHTMSHVNTVTWSLEVEVQFYVLAPLAMMLFRISNKVWRRGILGSAVLLIGLVQFAVRPHLDNGLFVTYHAQYFLVGLLIADIFVLDLEGMKQGWWWDAVAAATLLCMMLAPRATWGAHILLPYVFGLMCVAAMRGVIFRSFVSAPWVAVIGGMCYSIYLLHFAVIAAVFKFSRRLVLPQLDYLGNMLIQIVVVGIGIMLISTVFYMLVERPCMDPDWPGKLWNKLTGRTMHDMDVLDTADTAQDTKV